MPPVREPSTKPSAATVLPAPVACSNQKRLAALGSSGASGSCSSPLSSGGASSSQSCGSSGSSSSSPSSPGMPAEASDAASCALMAPFPFPLPFPDSASSAVSVPESASTWWAESSVPSASRGSSSLSRRSRPSSSDQRWRQPTDGTLAPSPISASAASNARRRGVPAARATAASSPASTNGSRVNAAARAIASSSGMAGAAWTATGVDSAIRLGQIQVEGVATYVRCAAPRIRGPSPRPDRREGFPEGREDRTPRVPSIEAECGAVSIHVPPYDP